MWSPPAPASRSRSSPCPTSPGPTGRRDRCAFGYPAPHPHLDREREMKARSLGAMLAAMVLLAACSGGASGGGSGPTTLTLWARDSEKTFIGQIVDGFNQSHKDIHVNVTIIPANNSFVQKLGTATATGSGPDVVSIDLVFVPYFAKAGALMDITSRANGLSYLSGFDSPPMPRANYNRNPHPPPSPPPSPPPFSHQ